MVYHPGYDTFVQLHQPQLTSSGIPEHFWPTVHRKILNDEFDAGDAFLLLQIDYKRGRDNQDPVFSLQVKLDSIKRSDPERIYLVDHAWTFRVNSAKKQLENNENLLNRMAIIMGVDVRNSKSDIVDLVLNRMWKYCNSYSLGNVGNIEDRLPVWYINDELGSAIIHSDSPNFRLIPFLYIPQQITYSLLFPNEDVTMGDFVTKDFAEGISEEDERAAHLLPWRANDFRHVGFNNIIPSPEYFLNGHIEETLPILSKLTQKPEPKNTYKVFSEYSLIHNYLKDSRFALVNNEEEADILWYTKHFKDYEKLSNSSHKFVNQFPFEYILTIKDLLCVVCRRKNSSPSCNLETFPLWLPTTFNLKLELIKFISYYQNREEAQMDNYWIIKPFNLARGLDMHITNNIDCIIRLSTTGPKIAQKYIENPVLFHRVDIDGKVKFDIRYVILLRSVKPLKVYLYKTFFLRFANKSFEMRNFDEYEKHFTVMNYTNQADLKKMLCSEFKVEWELQNPNYSWESVEGNISKMLKEIFECATMEHPPCGVSESPQSRAMYAADIMLEWNSTEIQPKILEINWIPDCKRACEYYPDFIDSVFKLLFLDEEDNTNFILL